MAAFIYIYIYTCQKHKWTRNLNYKLGSGHEYKKSEAYMQIDTSITAKLQIKMERGSKWSRILTDFDITWCGELLRMFGRQFSLEFIWDYSTARLLVSKGIVLGWVCCQFVLIFVLALVYQEKCGISNNCQRDKRTSNKNMLSSTIRCSNDSPSSEV